MVDFVILGWYNIIRIHPFFRQKSSLKRLMDTRFIDVDGHIMEPQDLWQDYIEPKFRDRALKIEKNEKGWEHLSLDGRQVPWMQGGTLGTFGAIGKDIRPYLIPGNISWREAMLPGSYDPHERVKVMDAEGIDMSFLYPSLGLCWEYSCKDAKLAAACCRAYNNWLFDFCKPYPERLAAVAHIPVLDIQEGVKELERSAKQGAKAAMVLGLPPDNLPLGRPYYDPLWAAAQDLDIPVTIHPGNGTEAAWAKTYPEEEITHWWSFVITPIDMMMHFSSFFNDATFERFPHLKLVILESGIGWLVYWLDRMEEKFDVNGFTTPMKLRPKEYFQRQCWFAIEPEEKLAKLSIEVLGADRFMWAFDYPHSDSVVSPVKELKENLASLREADQRKVFGENAMELYKLAA